MDEQIVRFHLHIYPAPDVRGQWVAHWLNLDIVTQGKSLEHAHRMAKEALDLCITADLQDGLDPIAVRASAPVEEWQRMLGALRAAGRTPSSAAVGMVALYEIKYATPGEPKVVQHSVCTWLESEEECRLASGS